jgi:hypothetical protein
MWTFQPQIVLVVREKELYYVILEVAYFKFFIYFFFFYNLLKILKESN